MIQLVDLRHPPSKDDIAMYDWLMQLHKEVLVVATKCDKVSKGQWQKLSRLAAGAGQIFAIDEFIDQRRFSHITATCQSNFRQVIIRIAVFEKKYWLHIGQDVPRLFCRRKISRILKKFRQKFRNV